jgi:hypothetical protein
MLLFLFLTVQFATAQYGKLLFSSELSRKWTIGYESYVTISILWWFHLIAVSNLEITGDDCMVSVPDSKKYTQPDTESKYAAILEHELTILSPSWEMILLLSCSVIQNMETILCIFPRPCWVILITLNNLNLLREVRPVWRGCGRNWVRRWSEDTCDAWYLAMLFISVW